MTTHTLPPPPWPFPALPQELRFLEDVDHVMRAPELVRLGQRIAATGAWRDYIVESHDYRDYRLVFENEYTDIWVLSWLPGQTTGFHDHDISEVGITVLQGSLREGHMHMGAPSTSHVMHAGDTQEGTFGYIHQVQHEEGEIAASLHAYSPPLLRVGQYRERDGRMIRLPEPGRTRLTPG